MGRSAEERSMNSSDRSAFGVIFSVGTLESVKVTESLAEDTVIFHQMHKRVWPSTQRETLFCSHLCTLSDTPHTENMVGRTWMVCNFSLEHPSVPVSDRQADRQTD